MDVARLLRGLDSVETEAERRQSGEEPDVRFDGALDAVLDLMDELEPPLPGLEGKP